MFQEAPGFERRLSDLQAQIDRLTISLQLWRDGQERLTPADERLSRFADDASDVLEEWNRIGERHARAVTALEQQVSAFSSLEDRLHKESTERFVALQRMVQQEWATLRSLEFEPTGARRQQAAELTHACVTATTAHGLASEPPPADDTERELEAQLAHVIVGAAPALVPKHSAVTAPPAAAAPPVPEVSAGPVDDVRVSTPDVGAQPHEPRPAISLEYTASEETKALRSEMASRMADFRILLRDVEARAAEDREALHSMNVRLWAVLAVLLVVLAAGAWWAVGLSRQLNAAESRLAGVEADAARAAADAAAAAAAARAESARQSEQARRMATERETVGSVLAAPDLIRYGLGSVDGSLASAQLLWSRSRGLVLSAMRLAPAPEGLSYTAWLLTESGATNAGDLQVDAAGGGMLVSAPPPIVRQPLVGVSITLEPGDHRTVPTGRVVALNRVPRPTP